MGGQTGGAQTPGALEQAKQRRQEEQTQRHKCSRGRVAATTLHSCCCRCRHCCRDAPVTPRW